MKPGKLRVGDAVTVKAEVFSGNRREYKVSEIEYPGAPAETIFLQDENGRLTHHYYPSEITLDSTKED